MFQRAGMVKERLLAMRRVVWFTRWRTGEDSKYLGIPDCFLETGLFEGLSGVKRGDPNKRGPGLIGK